MTLTKANLIQQVHNQHEGYTSGAAYVLGMEDQVGTLVVGKYADYVVLEESPLDVDPMKIKDIKIKQTVMGGMTTFLAE